MQLLSLEGKAGVEPLNLSQVFSQHVCDAELCRNSPSINYTFNKSREKTACSILQHLIELKDRSSAISDMLRKYCATLVRIATKFMSTLDQENSLLSTRIAEACFTVPLSERGMAIYGCGDLEVLPAGQKPAWARFWRGVLSKCPYAPTLFDTFRLQKHISPQAGDCSEVIPRFLFRVFDRNSKGRNDENKIVSQATANRAVANSSDLLLDEGTEATRILFEHLKWYNCRSDKIVSWTSSLLVAIQYAYHRCYKHSTDHANVKICAVDTSQFLWGQFVLARHLILAFNHDTFTNSVPGSQKFFDFRLQHLEFGQGEYLSQGLLNLFGRSSITSLNALKSSGLVKLYLKLSEPGGGSKWAYRLCELRRLWSGKSCSTREELRTALRIASRCLNLSSSPGMSLAVALMLLCFKNRELKGQKTAATGKLL